MFTSLNDVMLHIERTFLGFVDPLAPMIKTTIRLEEAILQLGLHMVCLNIYAYIQTRLELFVDHVQILYIMAKHKFVVEFFQKKKKFVVVLFIIFFL